MKNTTTTTVGITFFKTRKVQIKQMDLNGNVVKIWESAASAARGIGCDNSGISKCAKGKLPSYGGYRWAYVDEPRRMSITDEQRLEIISYFKSNIISVSDMSKHFGIPEHVMAKILCGVEKYGKACSRGNRKIEKCDYERIKEKYLSLESITDIAHEYGVSNGTINSILKSCGVELYSQSERAAMCLKKEINEYFDDVKSLKACIDKFNSRTHSRFEIINILSEKLYVDDNLIIDVFYTNGELSSTVSKHYFSDGELTGFEKRIVDYVKNRFDDSESIKESLYRIYYKIYERPLCAECHKNKVHFTANKYVFTKFCGRQCSRRNEESQNNYRATLLERYGDEHYNNTEKFKKTCIERYGKENVFQTDWCKKKIVEHWADNYGVRNSMQVEAVKEKAQSTCLEKYGCTNFLHSEAGIAATKKTMNERYGCDYTTQNKELMDKAIRSRKATEYENVLKYDGYVDLLFTVDEFCDGYENELPFRCKMCGKEFMDVVDTNSRYVNGRIKSIARCPNCFPISTGTSYGEKELLEYVKTVYDGRILWHDRENRKILGGKEIDIYCPDVKIGLEFNGVYWHSSEYKDDRFHLEKTKRCEELGIRLIHVFEDDWAYNQETIKKHIRSVFANSYCVVESNGIIVVDRSLYNKCCSIDGFELISESEPTVVNRTFSNQTHSVYNCGELVYKKAGC